MRRLIVNADDFGFTTDVNTGIVEAHRRGILTAATLMATGQAFEHAADLARAHPTLDVGCHLVLTGGRSAADPAAPLPVSVRRLLWKLCNGSGRGWIERELAAQVEKILGAGLRPTHLDTHKHTHLAPPVLEAVCRISERYSIRWLRRPFDLPLSGRTGGWSLAARAATAGTAAVRRRFDRTLAHHRCRTTDHFAGFAWTGQVTAERVAALIRSLPEGLTELMCHPGHCREELLAAPTRLKQSREQELGALVSTSLRGALAEAGVELVNYRSLS